MSDAKIFKFSEYEYEFMKHHLWDNLSKITNTAIQRKLATLDATLSRRTTPIWISLGENCGPAIKIRDSGLPNLGGSFFDNLVVPLESMLRIFDNRFQDLFEPLNLEVGEWEGHDSVFNNNYKMFFHHYFHVRGNERSRIDPFTGVKRRHIMEEDIILFLPMVLSQFSYLRVKFLNILRHEVSKVYVVRTVNGAPVSTETLWSVREALAKLGGNNFRIIVVYAQLPEIEAFDLSSQYYIAEHDERWGETKQWESLSTII
jgi:hypothetical protein